MKTTLISKVQTFWEALTAVSTKSLFYDTHKVGKSPTTVMNLGGGFQLLEPPFSYDNLLILLIIKAN